MPRIIVDFLAISDDIVDISISSFHIIHHVLGLFIHRTLRRSRSSHRPAKGQHTILPAHTHTHLAHTPQLIFSLLVAFPLGSIFVRLPSAHPNVAHLFSIAISTVFLVPLLGLGGGMLHMLFSSLGTYAIVNGMKDKNMPWVVFA